MSLQPMSCNAAAVVPVAVVPVAVAVELGVLAAAVEVLHWPSILRGAAGVPCAGVVALLALAASLEVLMALQVQSSSQQQKSLVAAYAGKRKARMFLDLLNTCQAIQKSRRDAFLLSGQYMCKAACMQCVSG
jgi:hypothetical protein